MNTIENTSTTTDTSFWVVEENNTSIIQFNNKDEGNTIRK